jgi:hypothetical protein
MPQSSQNLRNYPDLVPNSECKMEALKASASMTDVAELCECQDTSTFGMTTVTYRPGNGDDDEDEYMCTGVAGPAGTLNDNGEPVPIPEAEVTRLLNAREAAYGADSMREANERERRETAELNNQRVPASQPYYNGLTHQQAAKNQASLDRKFVRNILRPGRSDDELEVWLQTLADWEEETPEESEISFPLMVPGYNRLKDAQIAQLREDIELMRATVTVDRQADGSWGLRLTRHFLQDPRSADLTMQWLNRLADLAGEALDYSIDFLGNVPGYTHLSDIERAQLDEDIATMYMLLGDDELGNDFRSPGNNRGPPSPPNGPCGSPKNGNDVDDDDEDDHYNNSRPSGAVPRSRRSDTKSDAEYKALLQKREDQQYLETVVSARRSAEAPGHTFSDGTPGWSSIDEVEQNRIRWADYTIEQSGGIERLRLQWNQVFDRALARRFEDSSNAHRLRLVGEARHRTRIHGLLWPEDGMDNWPDCMDGILGSMPWMLRGTWNNRNCLGVWGNNLSLSRMTKRQASPPRLRDRFPSGSRKALLDGKTGWVGCESNGSREKTMVNRFQIACRAGMIYLQRNSER